LVKNGKREVIDSNSTTSLANRDLLARLCLNINNSPNKKTLFQIEIIFNDYHRLAQSSLVETNYLFRFYRLSNYWPMDHGLWYNQTTKTIKHIKSTLIFNNTNVSQNERVIIENLRGGVFLIEEIIFKNLEYKFIFNRR
jgi:hypothetical protein